VRRWSAARARSADWARAHECWSGWRCSPAGWSPAEAGSPGGSWRSGSSVCPSSSSRRRRRGSRSPSARSGRPATLSQTRDATLVFLGGSMLLAADRGYGGCETLAIGNWLLRRNDQVGCLLFGPLDAFAGAARASVSVSAALGPIHRVPSRRLPLDTNAGATPAYAPYLVLRQSQVPCRRSARDNRGQSSNPRASRGLRSSRRKCLCRTKAGHQA